MAAWKALRFNSHRLDLGDGLTCSVDWSTVRDDKHPWRARIFGNEIGGAETLEAAKLNTEKLVADILKNALAKLAE